MQFKKISELATFTTPTGSDKHIANHSGVTKAIKQSNFVPTKISAFTNDSGYLTKLNNDTSPKLAADLDANSKKIKNLPVPVYDSDAATKKYVDLNAGGGGGGAATKSSNNGYEDIDYSIFDTLIINNAQFNDPKGLKSLTNISDGDTFKLIFNTITVAVTFTINLTNKKYVEGQTEPALLDTNYSYEFIIEKMGTNNLISYTRFKLS